MYFGFHGNAHIVARDVAVIVVGQDIDLHVTGKGWAFLKGHGSVHGQRPRAVPLDRGRRLRLRHAVAASLMRLRLRRGRPNGRPPDIPLIFSVFPRVLHNANTPRASSCDDTYRRTAARGGTRMVATTKPEAAPTTPVAGRGRHRRRRRAHPRARVALPRRRKGSTSPAPSTARAPLKTIEQPNPSLVVLDLMLPG